MGWYCDSFALIFFIKEFVWIYESINAYWHIYVLNWMLELKRSCYRRTVTWKERPMVQSRRLVCRSFPAGITSWSLLSSAPSKCKLLGSKSNSLVCVISFMAFDIGVKICFCHIVASGRLTAVFGVAGTFRPVALQNMWSSFCQKTTLLWLRLWICSLSG